MAKHTRAELVIQVSNMLDDNLHLLHVIKLQLSDSEEAYAIFEEVRTQMEDMALRWNVNKKNGKNGAKNGKNGKNGKAVEAVVIPTPPAGEST